MEPRAITGLLVQNLVGKIYTRLSSKWIRKDYSLHCNKIRGTTLLKLCMLRKKAMSLQKLQTLNINCTEGVHMYDGHFVVAFLPIMCAGHQLFYLISFHLNR